MADPATPAAATPARLSRLKATKHHPYRSGAPSPSSDDAGEGSVTGECERQRSFGIRGGGRAAVDSLSLSLGLSSADDLYISDDSYSSVFSSRLSSSVPDPSIPGDGKMATEEEEEKEEEPREDNLDLWMPDFEMEESGVTAEEESEDDDDAGSLEAEVMSPSPFSLFKRPMKSWSKGQLIGRGSFGAVYEAISDDGFFFAVKEVPINSHGGNEHLNFQQLQQEIRILSLLEHENILRYLGMDKQDGTLHIFLELVTQGSLADLYRKYHLHDSQVSAYTKQILKGLNYLHSMNVIHRDIKCANILVDSNGLVKLADFGLAKEISKMNRTKSFKGTIYWMPPEVAKSRPYGPSADIWSLGCTVLEMLTRKPPYHGKDQAQALYIIGQGIPPHIPKSLSSEARDFIERCLQANPDDRPSAALLLSHPFVNRNPEH